MNRKPYLIAVLGVVILAAAGCATAQPAGQAPASSGVGSSSPEPATAPLSGTLKSGTPLIEVQYLNADLVRSNLANPVVSGVCGTPGDYGEACKYVGRYESNTTQGFRYMEIACGRAASSISTRLGSNAGKKTSVAVLPHGLFTVDPGAKGMSSMGELVWDAPIPFIDTADTAGTKSCVITFGLNMTGTGMMGAADLESPMVAVAKDVTTHASTWTRG